MRLLVVSNMWPGPAKPYFGSFVAARVEGYRRLGVDVAVAANDDPRTGPARNLLKYAALTLRALAAARRHRPDVVEGHYLLPTAVITRWAAAVARAPYVLYAHGSDVDVPPGPLGRLVAAAVRGAAEVQTNSPDTRDRLAARFPDVPIAVVPPAVDLDRFPPGPPGRGPIVAFVGNLLPVKGPDVLLEALARLPGEWRCEIAGDGPLRSELARRAESLGIAERIDWLGAVPHDRIGEVYRRARVLAVPSRRDAFGLAAVEALASGTPSVVTDVGGLPRLPDEHSGTVVPPEDPDRLAAALAHRLARPLDEATIAAARRRAEPYGAAAVAAEALARLEQVTSTCPSDGPGLPGSVR